MPDSPLTIIFPVLKSIAFTEPSHEVLASRSPLGFHLTQVISSRK